MEHKKSIELKEKELEPAAGGTRGSLPWTKDKYDPNRCKGLTERHDACRAVFMEGDCDHLNEKQVGYNADSSPRYNFSCNMGAFPPYTK